jgi:hypothetical protein
MPTFDDARAGFEAAWRVFLAKRTEAEFQAWRDARDWTARKYAMWERGERLPSQKPSLGGCPYFSPGCGARWRRTTHAPISSGTAIPS